MDIVTTGFTVAAWSLFVFMVFWRHRREESKPVFWRAVLVALIGVFVFAIHWDMENGQMLKIPVLPLGVWILYFFLKNKGDAWSRYRLYAWLGFFINFVFLAAALITVPVHHALFPKEEASTYIAKLHDAVIIASHPSVQEAELDQQTLNRQLSELNLTPMDSISWTKDVHFETSPNHMLEKFPYLLIGTQPKWGSGLNAVIYIERDAMGILIQTPRKHLYFRSAEPLLMGGSPP